jgi:hypothetical protein
LLKNDLEKEPRTIRYNGSTRLDFALLEEQAPEPAAPGGGEPLVDASNGPSDADLTFRGGPFFRAIPRVSKRDTMNKLATHSTNFQTRLVVPVGPMYTLVSGR